MTRTSRRWTGALLLALLFAACSSVRTEGHPDFVLRPGETFAWVAGSPPGPMAAELPWDEFRAAITHELEARGLQVADTEQADVYVEATIEIEVVMQQNDPNFELYVAERYERATLALELTRTEDPDISWSATRRQRLRYVAHTMGGLAGAQWSPVEEERHWELPDVVRSIFARLPVAPDQRQ